MRTPCQDNPEMWVSDLVTSRREAAELCNTCPAFDWCTRETIKAKPTHGVWAGRDYSRVDALARKPVTGEAKVCAECVTGCSSARTTRGSSGRRNCSAASRVRE